MGSLYALGHASVVIALGLIAIWLGAQLPEWIDVYMETIVGITLAALGVWIFWSMYRSKGQLVLKSRWMVVFAAAKTLYRKLPGVRDRIAGPDTRSSAYGPATSTGIGMIHGIGAETGSQALLLAAAAGATSAMTGSFLLLAFAIGLVVSNTFITFASVSGLIGARARGWTQIVLGVAIGVFSLVVGAMFIAQRGHLLPGLFA
jgi:high-affinity nickel-transport protein